MIRRLLVLLLLLAGCSGAAGGPEVRVIEVDGEVHPPLAVAGDALVALADPQARTGVVTSTDGRRWVDADLDGGRLTIPSPQQVRDLVVVAANGGAPPVAYLWVTRDGRRWDGGALADRAWIATQPEVVEAGDLVVAAVAQQAELLLWRWTGRAWERATVAGVPVEPGRGVQLGEAWETADGHRLRLDNTATFARPGDMVLGSVDGRAWAPVPCAVGCRLVVEGGGLLASEGQVSTDGGRTWQHARIDADLPRNLVPELRSVVREPGGGWLGVVAGNDARLDTSTLARSADGVRWRAIEPVACGRRYSTITEPVRFAGAWWAVRRCEDLNTVESSALLRIDGDDVEVAARSDRAFLTPVRWRGGLAVPEDDGGGVQRLHVVGE